MTRGEPAEILWGGFFLFSLVVSALLVLFQGLAFLRYQKRSGHRMIFDPPEHPREGIPFRAAGQLELPALFPSLRVHHRVTLAWGKLRRSVYRSPAETSLRPRSAETRFEIRNPLRGRYRIAQAAEITDYFTLFLFRCPGTGPEFLTILPDPAGETFRVPRPHRYSRLSTQKKESAEEFYETRKYYPGDDPRKINWKLYAHSKELFIRVGEEGVPKLERVFCLLLTGTPGNPLSLRDTDRITARFLREVALLHRNSEAEILILTPGGETYDRVEDPLSAAVLLSDVPPGKRPGTPDPVPDRGAWLVVSPAGDPELGGWLRTARERGIRPSLVLWESPRNGLEAGTLLRRLLLAGPERDRVWERKFRTSKRTPLWMEGERLTAAAGGGIHVRTE